MNTHKQKYDMNKSKTYFSLKNLDKARKSFLMDKNKSNNSTLLCTLANINCRRMLVVVFSLFGCEHPPLHRHGFDNIMRFFRVTQSVCCLYGMNGNKKLFLANTRFYGSLEILKAMCISWYEY